VTKATTARYTLEFKLEAVRLVKRGQCMATTAKILGIDEQTLHDWIKADRAGGLTGAGTKPVSSEQFEIARLRGAMARVKMERDILGHREAGDAAHAEAFVRDAPAPVGL
jgi:transposase